MKKLIAILLAVAMLLSLAACGGETVEDPNAGKYLGTTAKALGMTMEMSDIYTGETWAELKSGGKCSMMLDGQAISGKWALEGEQITITIQGTTSIGTLANGVLVVDLMDMGVEMTFVKEGMEAAAPKASYHDAGYYDLIRIDGATEEDTVSEEDLTMLRELGMYMYLDLQEDGTGIFFVDEEMPLTWQDGSITFTDDALTVAYSLENEELKMDVVGTVFVLRKGEKPDALAPVASEMEAAGFTGFMALGEPYAYTTTCSEDESKITTGEAIVTSYEIFEEAEGYSPLEGYEWRVMKMEVRFFDENAWSSGMWVYTRLEDYYNPKLHDDTEELVEETDYYEQYAYTIIHNGEEMDAYVFYNYVQWSGWSTDEAGNHEDIAYLQWDFLVPIGYDGCVAGLRDGRLELTDGTYITDYDPADFLLFRLK